MRLPTVLVLLLAAASTLGCKSKRAVVDTADRINNGVDIVPREVLAASRSTPTSLPAVDEDQSDLIQTLQDSQQRHGILINLIRESGLMRTLQLTGDWTLLAPTDEAFNKLPPGRLDWLLLPENHIRLVQFVQYHLIKGRISESQLQATNGSVTSYSGLPVIVRGIDGKVLINDANLIKANTNAVNGNLMWIDNILNPDTAHILQ